MHAVVRKMMLDEPVECFYDFREAFSSYWKQSYIIFFLGTLIPLFTGAASFVYAHMTANSFWYFIPCILSLFTFVASALASAYLYPLLSTGLPLKEIIHSAFLLGIGKPFRAFLSFAVNAVLLSSSVVFFPLTIPYILLIGLSVPCVIGQFFTRLNLSKYVRSNQK